MKKQFLSHLDIEQFAVFRQSPDAVVNDEFEFVNMFTDDLEATCHRIVVGNGFPKAFSTTLNLKSDIVTVFLVGQMLVNKVQIYDFFTEQEGYSVTLNIKKSTFPYPN